MVDAMHVFDMNLNKPGTSHSAAELSRAANAIVSITDRLNALLRTGTHDALEAQIEAEVGDGDNSGQAVAEVWRRVGGEYRDGLRMSDELVRSVTSFMLGVSRIVKDARSQMGSADGDGSVVGGCRSWDGRETQERTRNERSSTRDEGSVAEGTRSFERSPGTVADESRRYSARIDHRPQPRDDNVDPEDVILSAANSNLRRSGTVPANAGSSSRKLLTPREQRESRARLEDQYEPSPTPASRQATQQSISRQLQPISIPAPLPTLPSEISVRRNNSTASQRSPLLAHRRNKTSTLSVATARLPLSATPVSTISPSLSRNDSGGARTGVTFSRPQAASVSALNGLQESRSRASFDTSRDTASASPQTERDSRSRTLGTSSRSLARQSLDGGSRPILHHQASSGSVATRQERRRTITEIFA